jgi:hypothetical protein
MSYLGCTLLPTTTTEEEKMETETTPTVAYNPDMLVTYKVLKGYTDPEFTTDKVRNIEYELHNARQNSKVALQLQNKIDSVKSIIINSFPDSEDQDTLTEIAEALDIELTKEIQWSATISVSGVMQVPLGSDDFETELADNLFVDSQNGDIEINDYDVYDVSESY